jgi:UDP-glucose 4-epimerase
VVTDAVPGRDVTYLNVRVHNNVDRMFQAVRPNLVVRLAAETNIDKCKAEPVRAHFYNTVGILNVALSCKNFEAYVGLIRESVINFRLVNKVTIRSFMPDYSEPSDYYNLADICASISTDGRVLLGTAM